MEFTVNPQLVIEPIDGEFYAVANPLVKDGLKVINSIQMEVLRRLADGMSLQSVAAATGLRLSQAEETVRGFLPKKIVSADGVFEDPPLESRSLSLWVQTTNACNLRCDYCYIRVKDNPVRMDDRVMRRLREKILATVEARGIRRVSLRLSGGEPFIVAAPWMEFIRKMRADLAGRGCGFKPVFLTNGTLVTDTIARLLKEEDVGIAISLDGTRDEQDAARKRPDGSGSFDAVMAAMDTLRGAGRGFSIMTVLSNANIPSLPEITGFLVKTGARFRYSIADGAGVDFGLLSDKFNESLKVFEKHIDRGYAFSNRFKLCDLKPLRPSPRTCASGYTGGAVYCDGGIFFCQKHFGEGEALGTLGEDEDIISVVRRGAGRLALPDECTTCPYRLVCSGGCPLEREGGSNPECSFYREFIPKLYGLMGRERLIALKKRSFTGRFWPTGRKRG